VKLRKDVLFIEGLREGAVEADIYIVKQVPWEADKNDLLWSNFVHYDL